MLHGMERAHDRIAFAILAIASAAVFVLAPADGHYWWSEAPRNVLNGIFLRDLLMDQPIRDPVGWAFPITASIRR